MRKKITVLRTDDKIVVEPTTRRVRALIEQDLTYIEKSFFHGYERKKRLKHGLPPFEEIEWQCYGEDHKGRLSTSWGFCERIVDLLEKDGYPVEVRWATKGNQEEAAQRAETVYKPRWDRIEQLEADGFKFRYKQRKALNLIATFENGRISCPPAWGKGTLIMLASVLFPKAKIAVVTDRVDVLQTRLYPELAMNLPSVGIVGGGMRRKGRRVMCYTADSLHHCPNDVDFVFVDEGHEACADKFAESMGKFSKARIWMFSATWDMRLDNKDIRAEAMAGKIRLHVPYQKAVEHGMVVPVEVIWDDVIMDENPCSGLDGVDKDRAGIWANDYRNKLIAKNSGLYGPEVQELITCKTLEHALHLKKILPGHVLVYSGQQLKDRDIRWFRDCGLIDDTWRPMTMEKRKRLTKRFERGKLKKAIATTVWNVGVNFKQLAVVNRADAGGSPINDTQIPGRGARIDDVSGKKKLCAIIHDYKDQFDTGTRMKAERRGKSYDANEWRQHHPKKEKRSLLRQLMEWGNPLK